MRYRALGRGLRASRASGKGPSSHVIWSTARPGGGLPPPRDYAGKLPAPGRIRSERVPGCGGTSGASGSGGGAGGTLSSIACGISTALASGGAGGDAVSGTHTTLSGGTGGGYYYEPSGGVSGGNGCSGPVVGSGGGGASNMESYGGNGAAGLVIVVPLSPYPSRAGSGGDVQAGRSGVCVTEAARRK